MRRLLFVEHHPVFGGPHQRAIRLAAPLAEAGWETVALLPDEPGTAATRCREAGLEVVTMPLSRMRRTFGKNTELLVRLPSDVRAIGRALAERQIDAVVVAGLESPHAAFAGRRARLPVIWQINGTQTPPAYRRFMVPVARRVADVVMTTGRSLAAEYPGIEKLGERWIPFLSPVDIALFRPDRALRASARERLGLDGSDLVVGMVANFNPQKGHPLFIDAAAELRTTMPEVKFVLLGARDKNHGAFEAALWEQARRLGLDRGRDILVRDPGVDVVGFEPAFDVAWLTSVPRSEGVATAVIEATALGLPVVATAVGGIRDVVLDGVNGYVVPPGDGRALARATQRLLADPSGRAAMGRESRWIAVSRCRTEICAGVHLNALEIAVRRARRRRVPNRTRRAPLIDESR